MSAAWACALDFSPPKVTVVIDKATRTRALVEGSGTFALCVPSAGLAALTLGVGTDSALTVPDKLARHGVKTFHAPGHEALPLVEGCVAWLVCRLLPEPHNQATYDLFIGEVVGAWADERVFRAGRWRSMARPITCAPCTTWPGGSSTRRARRCRWAAAEARRPSPQ